LAIEDSSVLLSPSKAKELKVKEGDTVVLIGRRRHASYGHVQIGVSSGKRKDSDSSCTISQNMASNLRLRQDDKVKVVSLKSADQNEARSGDLLLLKSKETPVAATVTFAPVEDSLNSLTAVEGGDELSDEEILQRFVQPYVENSDDGVAFLKQGHLLSLRDENGKKLDFYVSNIETEEDVAENDEDEEGTYLSIK
jgi:formylmethanofuran dehydrogenase subunit D